MKCFYHNADLDGLCSAAIVKSFESDIELIGVNYGDPLDLYLIEPNERIYIVDFSFPIEVMIEISAKADLIWIDHLKTALEAAYDAGFMASCGQKLEIGKAGCELTFEWFLGTDHQMPLAIYLLGRYDVWDWPNVPGAIQFQYGMRTFDSKVVHPSNQDFWRRVFFDQNVVEDIQQKGSLIYAYECTQNTKYLKSCGRPTEIDGFKAYAVNKGLCNSLVFDSLENKENYDVFIAFVMRKGEFNISLYSSTVDVSAIAKKYGGGGHAGASGFSCSIKDIPFLF